MSRNLQLIKVSDLPQATSIDNLLTLGVDNNNNSVKVPIELLKGNKGDTGESGGNLTSKSLYNITQTTGITYTDKTTARNAVTANLRGIGQIITYKLTSGWITEQYIGADVNGWTTESNWKSLGVDGGIFDASATTNNYSMTLAQAIEAVPTGSRKNGLLVKYAH